jgi:hypothetical protein
MSTSASPVDISPPAIARWVKYLRVPPNQGAADLVEALAADRDRLSAELEAARGALERISRAIPLPAPTPDQRDATIAELKQALTETEDFISDHVADIEDGQCEQSPEYLKLAIKCRDRARAVLATLAATKGT